MPTFSVALAGPVNTAGGFDLGWTGSRHMKNMWSLSKSNSGVSKRKRLRALTAGHVAGVDRASTGAHHGLIPLIHCRMCFVKFPVCNVLTGQCLVSDYQKVFHIIFRDVHHVFSNSQIAISINIGKGSKDVMAQVANGKVVRDVATGVMQPA